MKARHGLLVVLSALGSVGGVLVAAEPSIEFAGVLTAGGATRVALTDKATRTTKWLQPGDQFLGYSIARYDPKEDAVFLKKDGQEFRIGLAQPKTKEEPRAVAANAPTNSNASANAAAPASPSPSPATAATTPAPPLTQPTTPLEAPAQPPPASTAPATASAPAAAPNAGDALAPTGTRYITRAGDTPASIARANGITVEQLQQLNPGLTTGSLQPGQTIRIR